MDNEEWKVWPGDPNGFYEVSTLGNARSWHKRGNSTHINVRAESPHSLKFDTTNKGYRRVAFYLNGKTYRLMVNRLVLETFIGPAPTAMHQAAHNNGKHQDNALSNLRWATPLENAADRKKHGTQVYGVRHHSSAFTEEQVKAIRSIHDRGIGVLLLGKALGASDVAIRNMVTRKTWKEVE